MDNTAVSEYENISIPNGCSESLLYQAVNNVLSITTANGNRIFCPLCVSTFEFKFGLLDHLKTAHFGFLCRTTEKSFIFEECPFCYANFFGRQTVMKHVLRTHSKVVVQLYLQVSENPDSPSKCFFCTELFLRKLEQKFIFHIEHAHLLEFSETFQEQFMQIKDSLISPETCKMKQNCFDLSQLKEEICYIDETQSIIKCKTKPNSLKKKKVCRVLFDLPVSDKENIGNVCNSSKQITLNEHSFIYSNYTKQGKILDNLLERSPTTCPIHSSTPKALTVKKVRPSNPKIKIKTKKSTFKSYCFEKDLNFQCGKCDKLFEENSELNCHIKKNHKMFILNLLHPCYQCAICKAKFYKNYYLKKHAKLHSIGRKWN